MSKRGFTLIELLVYMAIVGIVVVLAGQVYSNSTKMRVRTQSMLQASTLAENIGQLMKEDISQMGTKSSREDDSHFQIIGDVYTDPDNTDDNLKDSSSFAIELASGCQADCQLKSLTTKRILYSSTGTFSGIETVLWTYDGKNLTRHCETTNRPDGASANESCPDKDEDNTPVTIAQNVSSLKIIPAKPSVISSETVSSRDLSFVLPSSNAAIKKFRLVPRFGDENFNYLSTDPEEGDTQVRLTGFITNYNFETEAIETDGKQANQVFVAESNGLSGSWSDLCKQVTLEPEYEYEISFETPYIGDESRMFCPGRDYAAVGFRNLDGSSINGLKDFAFYLPTTAQEPSQKTFKFNISQKTENVCMAFTFASYSPIAAKGSVTISNLSLRKRELSSFNFDDLSYAANMKARDKKNIKAFKLLLSVKNNGESGEVSLIIPTPSNGPRD